MSYVDFQELKAKVTLEDCMRMLSLQLTPENNQFRGRCPTCDGADRGLIVTPAKGWYCQAAKIGGDVISLTAHVKQCGAKEAGAYLASCLQSPVEKKEFDPEAYAANLDTSVEALARFGVSADLVDQVGWIGVAKKGVNRGKLVFPLRGEFGEFIDFIGVENVSLPRKWRADDE